MDSDLSSSCISGINNFHLDKISFSRQGLRASPLSSRTRRLDTRSRPRWMHRRERRPAPCRSGSRDQVRTPDFSFGLGNNAWSCQKQNFGFKVRMCFKCMFLSLNAQRSGSRKSRTSLPQTFCGSIQDIFESKSVMCFTAEIISNRKNFSNGCVPPSIDTDILSMSVVRVKWFLI